MTAHPATRRGLQGLGQLWAVGILQLLVAQAALVLELVYSRPQHSEEALFVVVNASIAKVVLALAMIHGFSRCARHFPAGRPAARDSTASLMLAMGLDWTALLILSWPFGGAFPEVAWLQIGAYTAIFAGMWGLLRICRRAAPPSVNVSNSTRLLAVLALLTVVVRVNLSQRSSGRVAEGLLTFAACGVVIGLAICLSILVSQTIAARRRDLSSE